MPLLANINIDGPPVPLLDPHERYVHHHVTSMAQILDANYHNSINTIMESLSVEHAEPFNQILYSAFKMYCTIQDSDKSAEFAKNCFYPLIAKHRIFYSECYSRICSALKDKHRELPVELASLHAKCAQHSTSIFDYTGHMLGLHALVTHYIKASSEFQSIMRQAVLSLQK